MSTDISEENRWILAQNPDWKLDSPVDGEPMELAVAIELMDTQEAGIKENGAFWMLPRIIVQPQFFGPKAREEIKRQSTFEHEPDIWDALYILNGAEVHWQVYVLMTMRGLENKKYPGITWSESEHGPWVSADNEEHAIAYVKEVMLPFIEELMQIDDCVETMMDFPFNQAGEPTWTMLNYLIE